MFVLPNQLPLPIIEGYWLPTSQGGKRNCLSEWYICIRTGTYCKGIDKVVDIAAMGNRTTPRFKPFLMFVGLAVLVGV
ncbi:hypothetical protein RHMOL_Rhmol07G0102100 [Rhododendron molle]|uniref:Uncharacterized protein n=1 Tax=Rhododendron molle TaxID=49168 RepID=A0ACC0MZ21_RHOML|nr:hypothetical protein RHMOL_Rhmol07G0102100 [Rhododendron molle]